MDATNFLALIVGVNTGLILGGVICCFLYMRHMERADLDDDEDYSRERPSVGVAMSTLCSAVNSMNPGWRSIEIVRDGDSRAQMTVIGGDNPPEDEPGNKLH